MRHASRVLALLAIVGMSAATAAQNAAEKAGDREIREQPASASRDTPRPGDVASTADLSGTRGDVIVEGDGTYPNAGVLLRPKTSWPWVVAQTGTSDTSSGFAVFNSSQTRTFLADGAGNVHVGYSGSSAKFLVYGGGLPVHVMGESSNGFGLLVYDMPGGVDVRITGNSVLRAGSIQLGLGGGSVMNSVNSQPLYINRWVDYPVVIGASNLPNSNLKVEGTGSSGFNGNLGIGTLTPTAGYRLDVRGNSTFTGDANFTGTVTGGNIQAKYQDVAEWVPTVENLRPGTVVTLDPRHDNHVVASTRPYDTYVAGVVSAQPGLILGEGSASKAMIATTGRVRVRVDAAQHPIAIGDLLVTSDKPGLAMKSIPLDFQGIAMHRPGTVVGKALEPLAKGEGEILVLLSLQ